MHGGGSVKQAIFGFNGLIFPVLICRAAETGILWSRLTDRGTLSCVSLAVSFVAPQSEKINTAAGH